jgi:hypothetical protein
MLRGGFKPTTPVFEQAMTIHDLDRSANLFTVAGTVMAASSLLCTGHISFIIYKGNDRTTCKMFNWIPEANE